MIAPHARLARVAAALGLIVFLAGCGTFRRSMIRTAGGNTLDAPAAAATPARIDAATTVEVIPLPAGSTVEIAPAAPATATAPAVPARVVTLARDTELRRETRAETASTAHTAPPSAIDAARASGVRAFWIAGLCCLGGAGLLAWSGHWLAAGCAFLAGVALPVLASVLSSHTAVVVGVAFCAVAVGLVSAWYIITGRLKTTHDAIAGEAVQV